MSFLQLLMLTLILIKYFNIHVASNVNHTQRASKSTIDKINALLNQKIEEEIIKKETFIEFADSPVSEVFILNKKIQQGKPRFDELLVNNPDNYFHGDIELTEWQALHIQKLISDSLKNKILDKNNLNNDDKINNLKRRTRRKIGQPINYDFADSMPESTRQTIRYALSIWQKNTCLRFQEGGSNVDRLEFYDGGGCSSFIGRIGGIQGISISTPGCEHVGIIAHEIGHALGIFHEQARPDQKHYITIHYQNIPVSRWNNFYPIGESQAATYNLPYDAGSVMHYGSFGFALDPYKPTITTIDRNLQSTIGQRIGPSFIDVKSINVAYKCYKSCPVLKCKYGGYPNPNNCSRCICPNGFGGKLCQHVQYSDCGGVVEVSQFTIFINSPNYPNKFPKNKNCIWLIKSKLVTSKIVLEFVENFQYQCEASMTCDKSFVEIKTGPDFSVTGYRFCCSIIPLQKFISSKNEIILLHNSNDVDATIGFKVRIQLLEINNINENKTEFIYIKNISKLIQSTKNTKTNLITTTSPFITIPVDSITTYFAKKYSTIQEKATLLPGEESKTEFYKENTTKNLTAWSLFTSRPLAPLISSSLLPMALTTTNKLNITKKLINIDLVSRPGTFNCLQECTFWSEWSVCNQQCGGCGRRFRHRQCSSLEIKKSCLTEEKRICNFEACPKGTNFLFNNAEFHILWKGCCVGMLKKKLNNNEQCAPIDSENAFIKIISSLLTAQDFQSKNKTTFDNVSKKTLNNKK